LDANVLFSAAYAPDNCFLVLWEKKGIRLLSSEYAVHEARRNLTGEECLKRLERLVGAMEIMPGHITDISPTLFSDTTLPEKDGPIMIAAIGMKATHLLTGDRRHFGPYFGKQIDGVLIQLPSQYLRNQPKPPRGV
jgi:predicted nucleic acid-binding protein